MNIEDIREMCLGMHSQVTEDAPFGTLGSDDVAFRIAGKIFAFLLVDDSRLVVLKSEPERAIELREKYADAIEPAFHWNKKFWNQVHYDSLLLGEAFTRQLIRESFEEVLKKLPRKTRTALGL